MDTKAVGRGTAGEPYYYRRALGRPDYLVAGGVGLGLGVLGFYVATLFFERTPLVPDRPGEGGAAARPPRTPRARQG